MADDLDLVTGASGLIGSRLVQRLIDQGRSVRALVRPHSDVTRLRQDGVQLVTGDLNDSAAVSRAMDRVGRVFHCGAMVSDWGPRRQFYRVNVDGTRHVVIAALTAGVQRLIHLSSAAVYGYPRRGSMLMFDGGRHVAGLAYVDNVVDAIWLAGSVPEAVAQTMNVCDDSPITWRQYLDALADGLGIPRARFSIPSPLAYAASIPSEMLARWSSVQIIKPRKFTPRRQPEQGSSQINGDTNLSDLEIQPVRNRRQRHDFLQLMYQLNTGRPLFVPPLRREHRREMDPQHNPFYEHAEAELFVAYRANKPVGRIAAIENRSHNQHWNDRIGFFGHYEAIDDPDVSRSLFTAAEDWLRARGLDRMRGPTNPSMNANVGFLIDGFEHPPTIPMPYTQPFYPQHAEAYGFDPVMRVLVYGWNYSHYTPQYIDRWRRRIARLSQFVEQRSDIRIRGPRRDRVDEELQLIREICNESMQHNWGFVPLTDGEMNAVRRELERIIDPDMFFLAEIDGRPEAVFIACPDYNELLALMNGRVLPFGWLTYLRHRRKIQKYVVYVYASTPRAEAMGAAAVLYRHYFDNCFRKGIMHCETSYVLEANTLMRNSIENLGAQLRKRYQLYEKPIVPVAS